MADQIMETLTNEEHERLLLMSEHAIAPTLSPAAQAVLDAFLNGYACKPSCNVAFEADRNGIAAALRAAADQLGYGDGSGDPIINEYELLAIAAELEGAQ